MEKYPDITGYINAGGRGTRLSPIFTPHPEIGVSKALLEVGTPPLTLIEHHINALDRVTSNVVVGAGDHINVSEFVKTRFSTNTQPINYSEQLGTGGDLVRATRDYPESFGKQILITNVDTFVDINAFRFLNWYRRHGLVANIVVTLNKHVPNEGAFHINKEAKVVYNAESANQEPSQEVAQHTHLRASSTGMVLIETQFIQDFGWLPQDGTLSLYRDILGEALNQGQLGAFNNGHKLFVDIGTVYSWQKSANRLQKYLHYAGERIVA